MDGWGNAFRLYARSFVLTRYDEVNALEHGVLARDRQKALSGSYLLVRLSQLNALILVSHLCILSMTSLNHQAVMSASLKYCPLRRRLRFRAGPSLVERFFHPNQPGLVLGQPLLSMPLHLLTTRGFRLSIHPRH